MSTYELIASLPLEIEGYEYEPRELDLVDFTRYTTLIRLRGGGQEGVGEDVVYDGIDHVTLQADGRAFPLSGSWTIDSFSRHLDSLDLFPAPPVREPSRDYRRWAFESAALDLALRQAGTSLAAQLGRELRPVNYVVSTRLSAPAEGEPETLDKLTRMLELYPATRFKLDPTNTWTDSLIEGLVELGCVDSLDLKGQYKGTPVDVTTDADLYARLVEAFPDAWLEDPDLTDETRPVLEPHRDRVTWDAPIHSVDDIRAREWEPRMVNIKPSRFGPLSSLFATYDFCDERGIGAYGGGQTELGEGREHIQYLAALFHPDTPNDVAPRGFNETVVPPSMPESPIAVVGADTGFRFAR
jgi:hypothetical protein